MYSYIQIFSDTNIRSYHIRIICLIRIYSDIRSYHFFYTNIFGYSFVSFFGYKYIQIFVRIENLYLSHPGTNGYFYQGNPILLKRQRKIWYCFVPEAEREHLFVFLPDDCLSCLWVHHWLHLQQQVTWEKVAIVNILLLAAVRKHCNNLFNSTPVCSKHLLIILHLPYSTSASVFASTLEFSISFMFFSLVTGAHI